jgi:hypothetical protein
MATARTLDQLVAQFGAAKAQSTAIIWLQQKERGKAIQRSLRT